MGIPSQMGALDNAIDNMDKLEFAKNTLSKEDFKKLHSSYNSLKWFQLGPMLVFSAIMVLELIFIPGQKVPIGESSPKECFMWMELGIFMLAYAVWLAISIFVCGRLWHKYSKWYEKGDNLEQLYALFKKKDKSTKG
jgi:hypothetical protein